MNFADTRDEIYKQPASEISQSAPDIQMLNDKEDFKKDSIIDIDMSERDFDLENELNDIVSYPEILDSPSFIDENISVDEGLYKCNLCGRQSKSRTNLKSHIESHSQTPSYGCSHCSKMCNTKNALNMHKKRTHSNYC